MSYQHLLYRWTESLIHSPRKEVAHINCMVCTSQQRIVSFIFKQDRDMYGYNNYVSVDTSSISSCQGLRHGQIQRNPNARQPMETNITYFWHWQNQHDPYLDGLVRERRNSSALAMELRLPCPSLGSVALQYNQKKWQLTTIISYKKDDEKSWRK